MKAKARMIEVYRKAYKHFGKTHPAEKTEFAVEVIPGKSISIFKNGELCNSFGMGDQAEYGSYNLSYFGPIVIISEKAVWIDKGHGSKALLDFYKFCWRNYNFDAAKAAEHNATEMMYL